MTEEIYQTIKSILEEARGDRYPSLARLLGPVEPHIKVNYEGSDQVKASDALAKEKARHDKITEALDWLETQIGHSETDGGIPLQEVSDATEIRSENDSARENSIATTREESIPTDEG